ncbi:MAG: hypothetical protein CMK89_19500 [Pseudomonadales bacterium]|nr:hypothetical protein [Pseudomonadales bacterium]
MHSHSMNQSSLPRHSGLLFVLALVLVWSLVASAAHRHQDEPQGFHTDCVFCLHQHNSSTAAFLAVAYALPSPTPAIPQTVRQTFPILNARYAVHPRAPPTVS